MGRKDYRDPRVLEYLLVDRDMTNAEVGEILGCAGSVISRHKSKYDIEKRKDWNDPRVLHYLYHERGLSQIECADILGCSQSNIWKSMRAKGIESRATTQERPLSLKQSNDGREVFWTSDEKIHHHRLLAVAYSGFEAVRDRVVHHENGIPWDNRPENLKVMTQSDHVAHHNRER